MRNRPGKNTSRWKISRKTVFLFLFIFIVSAVYVHAEDVKIKSHGKVRVKAKNARLAGKDENVPQVNSDFKTPPEFREIDDLSKEIRQTLASLQKDIANILAAIRRVAMRKSIIESEKQTIEVLSVQSDVKKQSMATLSGELGTLARKAEEFMVLYRQKDTEYKTLSAKLNELDIKRKDLGELHSVAGSFKNVDADSIALNMSANNDDVRSLHKRIADVLSEADTLNEAEKKRDGVQAGSYRSKALNGMPKWILDKIKAKGKKMDTAYGDILVVKDDGITIIAIKKENDAKFRSVYEKLIKDSYETDGMEYFVLGARS